ncbi:hypothetical protein BDV96DRAFT_1510 [Lophiotrema nucula]|uniref:Uncharacterized protein n=1 Tax=Lophiotrema nucula TaxID=690887 RepID=A0A6A5ZSL8_9PLEO|nr:hypothetical protein BDV96DRAFT_1510 [Lophiotrema nucula]
METRSVEDFLTVDEAQNARGIHRSRSGGYQDFLEDQVAWERRDRERRMQRYHGQRNQGSDRLYAPTFETVHRRVQSNEDIKPRKDATEKSYHVREQKPAYDLNENVPLPSQLPVKRQFSWKPDPSKTKMQIIIDQPTPPTTAKETPKSSPVGSPSSPSRPQLQFQFAALQNRFADIANVCRPNVHVEAANPRDLTFAKISEEVNGFAFQLRIWHDIVNMDGMTRIDRTRRDVVHKAAKTLDRLVDRANDLERDCEVARPRDLKIVPLPEIDDEEEYDDYADDEENGEKDVTEMLGYSIQASLNSIRLQIQTLSRLTRSLQEAPPDACDEVEGIERLVRDVGKFFGTEDALDRYHIDERFAGKKALDEAKVAAGFVR